MENTPATRQQIKVIQIAKRQLGLEEESYRGLLEGFGARSAKDLSKEQAKGVIQALEKLGFRLLSPARETPRRSRGNLALLPTPRQTAFIRHLAGEIAWREVNGFHKWLMRYYGTERVNSKETASRVIEGLKKLKEHGHDEHGHDLDHPRATSKFNHPSC